MSQIESKCRAQGLRLTGQRRLIAQVLSEARDHPDVPELHRRVAERDRRVSVATVYRTMKRFEEIGIVERHEFRDSRAHYEKASKAHHDHLIDTATGRVIEFRSAEIERLQEEIARRLGFRLVGHRLELYGAPATKAIERGPDDRGANFTANK
jgi:Fur family transcriptional regulator, ferric uptake regulator